MRKLILLVITSVCFFVNSLYAQVSITPGGTCSQDFNSIGSSATATLPPGWKVDKIDGLVRTVGNYSTAVQATTSAASVSMSSTASNGIYNYGSSTTSTDRAIGGLSSGSATKSMNLYVDLFNNGSGTIPGLTISYNVEKYRKGSNTAGFGIQMYYSADGINWTSAGANYLTTFTADADNSGYVTAPGTTSSISNQLLNVPAFTSGTHLYLAWNYSVSSGTTTTNAQALGIDDIQIKAGGLISNNADLSNLQLSSGVLNPAFSASTTSYTSSVNNATSSISITPTTADGGATVKVNGSSVSSGSASPAISLAVGSNTITTTVTAQDGTTTKDYVITIERQPAASASLSVSSTLAAFGNICTNTTAGPNSFTVSGSNLDGSSITVSALPGFSYCETADGTYNSSLTFSYDGNAFSGKTIYVKFQPASVAAYDGSIQLSGGGSPGATVIASGSGINTKPTVTTGTATLISTSATLRGSISATGCTAVSSYGIEYSTLTGFTSGTQVTASDLSSGAFSASISSLTPNTTYYYKAFAVNAAGTAYGAQQSFTTGAVPVVMSFQQEFSYTEDFGTINNWANGFTAPANATHFAPVISSSTVTIPNALKVTTPTVFSSGFSGGIQRGTGNIQLLSTGSPDNSTSTAFDLFLDFTGLNAGTLSFDWAEVNNSTGDRAGSVRVYASTDGSNFTELTGASVLNILNNVPASGSISAIELPASFSNNPNARLRFYYYNGTGGTTGSRPKISIDNLTVTAVPSTPCNTPTAGATDLVFSNITETSINGSFSSASPAPNKYLVVASNNSSLTSDPVDGQAYKAGDNLGDGTVVSLSSSTSFSATGLSAGSTYYFFIYSANTACSGGPKYLSGEKMLTGTATTVTPLPNCVAPAGPPAELTLTNNTINSIHGSFTTTDANEYLVVRSQSSSLSTLPVNGHIYNAGDALGNGIVVQRNSTNSFTATGLQPETSYYFYVFSLNSQSCLNGPVYNSSAATTSAATLPLPVCSAPATAPTALNLNPSYATITGSFNSSPNADNYLIVVSTTSSLTSLPVDNTDYTPGQNLGGGTVIANSSATSFIASNLTGSTTYYFFVFATNKNCTGGTKYFTTPLNGSTVTSATPAYQVYFGNLHSHSDYSDGNKDHPGYTPADDYLYAKDAECMDFLGISEHNHFSSVDNPGNIITNFHQGFDQADAFNATHPGFLALYGMEWGVISGGGHVVVYGDQMKKLFGWEYNVGGVDGPNYDEYVPKSHYTGDDGLFNMINKYADNNTFGTLAHPNSSDYNNLANLPYDAAADQAIVGSAVESGPANSTNTTYSNPGSSMFYLWYYQKLLSLGYHVGPTIDHDNHYTTFGRTTRGRTAVIAPALTQTEIIKAVRNMHFYATEDCDAKVDYTINNHIMGSQFSDRSAPSLSVNISDYQHSFATAKIRVMYGLPGSGNTAVAIDSSYGSTLTYVDDNLTVNTTGYYYIDITNGSTRIITSPIWYTRVCAPIEVTTTISACDSFSWNGAVYKESGTYSRQYMDPSGCPGTETLVLAINQHPSVSISAGGPTSFCPAGTLTLTATEAKAYNWSDGSSSQSISVSQTGTYTVTVTDEKGCTATSEPMNITVQDITTPEVHTRNLTLSLDASGSASIAPGDINDGSSDNCTIASLNLSKTNFTCEDVGANTVTLTVTDGSGNEASASAVVTVLDQMKPTVITRNISVQLDQNGIVNISTSDINNGSYDNCAIASLSLDKTSFNCTNLGNNTVTLSVKDASGNEASATAVVTVEDGIKPTVITKDITVSLDQNGIAAISAADIDNGSYDNCSIASVSLDKSSFTCADLGVNSVNLIVKDPSGNEATAISKVTVEDHIKPGVITNNITVSLDQNGAATISAADINNGSFDNCSIASFSLDKTHFTCADVGVNTVTLTVTDASGNQASASAFVTVEDHSVPIVITKNISVELDANGSATITDDAVNNGSSDNCGIQSYSLSKKVFSCSDLGQNKVSLTATDIHGNAASAYAIVTVVDNTAPQVRTQNKSIYLDANGTATISTSDINNGSTDNCSIASLYLDKINFSCADLGNNTITLSATDGSGNKNSATAIVTVIDNRAPVITSCPVVPVQCYNPAGTYTIPALTATDNCSYTVGYTITGSTTRSGSGNDASGSFNVGSSIVNWTVTDKAGNTTTCSTTVVINSPVFSSLPDVYAVKPGGAANTLYLGYGPFVLTLNGSVSGGTAPYYYKWTENSSAGPALSSTSSYDVSPAIATSYYFNVKDTYGCTATKAVRTIDVVDVRCGTKGDKVMVCQVIKGKATTSCVFSKDVAGLLAGGATLGTCPIGSVVAHTAGESLPGALLVKALPNPSSQQFILMLQSSSNEPLILTVTDVLGRLLEKRDGVNPNGSMAIGALYRPGIYFVRVVQGNNSQTLKLVKQGN